MKRSERIYLLLGVLAAACVAAFAALKYEQRQEQIKNSDEVILELPADSVTALSWENEDASLSFHKDERWQYDGDEAFPVDEDKIGEMLAQFESFGVAFLIEHVEDYGQYGLDKPLCTIRLETADQTYEVTLGDYSKMDEQRYVSIGDGNVYLVRHDPLDEFGAVLRDMIDQDEVPEFEEVSQIDFSGAQNYTVTYEEDSPNTYCAEDVYFTRQSGGTAPLDTARVEDYLDHLQDLDLTDYVTYNATDEELERCGLDSPELTVTVEYTAEEETGKDTAGTFVLHVSRDPEEQPDEDEEDEDITAYARVGDSPILYQISGSDYRALLAAGYDDLRHEEVLSADFADVTQMDITLDGSSYTLTADGKDKDRVWRYGEEEVETAALQSALENLKADSFTTEQPTGKQEISLTVHLDNETFPQVQITLYRYDGASCLAVVDGEPVCLVSRSRAVDLVEAINAIVLN